jgi:colanic acid biosynthesis glycosyl transferase WcaI
VKILAIYRHYWPDATPYAHLLKGILEAQHTQGNEVAVFTAQPSYNDVAKSRQPTAEVIAGVRVRRVRLLPERKHWRVLRVLNHLLFLVRAVWYCLRHERPDS